MKKTLLAAAAVAALSLGFATAASADPSQMDLSKVNNGQAFVEQAKIGGLYIKTDSKPANLVQNVALGIVGVPVALGSQFVELIKRL